MGFLLWLAVFVPSSAVALTVGRVVGSLDAPTPAPLVAAVLVGIAAVCGLDHLISSLQAHRAATRD